MVNSTDSKIPNLKELKNLKDAMVESSSQISDSMVTIRDNLGGVSNFANVDLNELEKGAIGFIAHELQEKGLLNRVIADNGRIALLLKEIEFRSKATDYVTGYFSSSFSAEHKKK